jgi:hypothetical protein
MKAHDMDTGYFLLFQYNGNMNFEVKVFDTSCCLKNYSLQHYTSYIEIEDSSHSEVPTLSNASRGELSILFCYCIICIRVKTPHFHFNYVMITCN